jgi:GNAT superfamily N-acetyltransferase
VSLQYVLDPPVTPELHDQLLRLWADVSNADGAVGFVPPVTVEDVRPELRRHLMGMAEGTARLLVALDEEGRAVGTAFFVHNHRALMRHWVWIYTLMLHPDWQGRGEGRELMYAVEQAARAMDGIEAIRLTCRGGTGVDAFYARCGYKEVGRVPGALKVADDDLRDDITMWLPL